MPRRIDIQGQWFGSLEVLRLSEKRNDHGTYLWECRCHACGSLTYILGTSLRAGHYTSCGCIRPVKRDRGASEHIQADRVAGTRKTSLKAKLHSGNKSGVKGVMWDANKQRWKAYIGFRGRNIMLGSYLNKDDAIAARRSGEEKYHKPYLEGSADEQRRNQSMD